MSSKIQRYSFDESKGAMVGDDNGEWCHASHIAAPVVERQPVELTGLSAEAYSVLIGMVEHCINVRACMGMDEGFKDFDTEEEHDFVKELHAFVADPPELAELQATIARLTAACAKEFESVQQLDNENQVLKQEIERLKGGHGEPVAVVTSVVSRKNKRFEIEILDNQKLHVGTWLYTSQPAPASADESDQALMDRHEAWKAGEAHGINSAAKLVEKRMDDYVNENGSHDPETGSVEFPGNGEEYVGELMEIIEQIQELACLDKVKELNG
jgi:uncharacterized small protein (DUF1192 family)